MSMKASKKTALALTRRQLLQGVPMGLTLGLGLGPLSALAQEPSAMEKIRARGTVKVALYKNNPPYSEGKGSDLTGLDVSLAQALAQRLNLTLALLPFDAGENMNDDLRNMVWKGHYLGYGPADVMLHVPVDRYLMNENKQALIFNAYCREHLVVLHNPQKLLDVHNPEDLEGQHIAVEQGTGAASALMGYRGGLLNGKVSVYKDGLDAAKAALLGQMDAAYVSRAQAESALFQVKPATPWALSNLVLPGVMPNGWPLGMAVKSDNIELAKQLETALNDLRDSGELVRIFASHGLTLAAP